MSSSAACSVVSKLARYEKDRRPRLDAKLRRCKLQRRRKPCAKPSNPVSPALRIRSTPGCRSSTKRGRSRRPARASSRFETRPKTFAPLSSRRTVTGAGIAPASLCLYRSSWTVFAWSDVTRCRRLLGHGFRPSRCGASPAAEPRAGSTTAQRSATSSALGERREPLFLVKKRDNCCS